MGSDHRPIIRDEAELMDRLTQPSAAVREAVAKLGDGVVVLGAGGKMGPSLAGLLVRAGARRVIGVSRFSDPQQQRYLEGIGVQTVRADLLDEDALAGLPEAPYVLLLAGFKFGASANEPATWAINTWLPARVVQRYAHSRIVYVSSGNVYAPARTNSRGSPEDGELGPVGEYAQSRLGGERVAQYFSEHQRTPLLIVRLFYATELRYGIISDLARKVWRGEPIDLEMGFVNQIWQGDANSYLSRFFPLCTMPAAVVNLTGPESLSVRQLAQALGRALGKEPRLTGREGPTALMGDASGILERFGPPAVSSEQIIRWVAEWVRLGGANLGKPTRYEARDGRF